MSDQQSRSEREFETVNGMALLEGPPSTGWVVHEVLSVKSGGGEVWAWCKVDVDGPGYTEISFTAADGSTPADPGTADLRLGRVITKVWC